MKNVTAFLTTKSSARFLLVTALVLFCSACSSRYAIERDSVSYISWNKGQGKVVKELQQADPQSFSQISPYFGKDKKQVFWQASLIEGAQPESFVVINDYYAFDKKMGL